MSEEKKQRFSQLLKYIRGNDSVTKFATRLGIKLPTYSPWEGAKAFPNDETWKTLLPKLCELSGFTPELIEQYLQGDYELIDLSEGVAQTGLPPRTKAVITLAKFRGWLQTLSLPEAIQVLKDATKRVTDLASDPRQQECSGSLKKAGKTEALVSQEGANKSLQITLENLTEEEATVEMICQLAENLSLENTVRVDGRVRHLILSKLQEIGLLEVKQYQNHPIYLLIEHYRLKNHLSCEQFEEILLREGREAGLNPSRVSQIVRGQQLPDDRELLWIGVFIKRPDGSLYDHEELLALRDGFSTQSFEENEAINSASDSHHYVENGCRSSPG